MGTSRADAVHCLVEALASRDEASFAVHVERFQRLVLHDVDLSSDETLGDVAFDLDYFEPDAKRRAEDRSFVDLERARELVRRALERLRVSRE